MIMWSAVILRILEKGSTRSPGHGSTTGCAIGPMDVAAAGGGGGGGGGGAGFGGSGLDAGGAEAAAGGDATAPFSVSITATSVCTGTVWPSCTLISASTPAAGAGISASTLSVEISSSGSSRFTGSPIFLSHLLTVPSAMDSPIWGMSTSMRAMSSPKKALSAVSCQQADGRKLIALLSTPPTSGPPSLCRPSGAGRNLPASAHRAAARRAQSPA